MAKSSCSDQEVITVQPAGSSKTMICVRIGLRALILVGLGLSFGGYLKNYLKKSFLLDPNFKAYRASLVRGSPKVEPKQILVGIGHLDYIHYDMVLAGFIVFVIASVASLVVYKGPQRGWWIGVFAILTLSQSAGLYLHDASPPSKVRELILRGDDLDKITWPYLGMILCSQLGSIIVTIGTRIFDRHGWFVRHISKFLFWCGYITASSAYYMGATWYSTGGNPLSTGVLSLKVGFSVMMVLGAYSVVSEAAAELIPAPVSPSKDSSDDIIVLVAQNLPRV